MSSRAEALSRQSKLLAFSGCLALFFVGISQPRWLLGSTLVWSYTLWLLFRGLPENRRVEGGEVLDGLGLPTLVTLFRGALLAAASGFLFLPLHQGVLAYLPAVCYTVASLLDHVDGRLARALGRTTRLGQKLDLELDAVGVLIASLLGVHFAKIPAWYVAIGLARYAFVAGIAWRRRRGRPVRSLDPSPARRVLAGVQMGFLAVALWPPVPASLTAFAAPLFGGATLAMFLRDWAWVSGRLRKPAGE